MTYFNELGQGRVGFRTPSSGGGGNTPSYLLDTYSGATGAYSLRKLRSAYTGNAITVRRSSDNTSQNIGFDANGNLDTTSLLSFVSSGDGFVSIWYDQTGSGYNFTQTSSSLQPKIVSSGVLLTKNSKPTILFDGASNYLNVPSSQNYYGFLHKTGQSYISFVGYSRIQKVSYFLCNNNGTSGQIGYSLYTEANKNIGVFVTRASPGSPVINNMSTNTPLTTDSLYLITNHNDPGNATASLRSSTYFNNNTAISNNTSTVSPSTIDANAPLHLGSSSQAPRGNYYDGGISELVIYNSNQSANKTGISTNINSYYSIY